MFRVNSNPTESQLMLLSSQSHSKVPSSHKSFQCELFLLCQLPKHPSVHLHCHKITMLAQSDAFREFGVNLMSQVGTHGHPTTSRRKRKGFHRNSQIPGVVSSLPADIRWLQAPRAGQLSNKYTDQWVEPEARSRCHHIQSVSPKCTFASRRGGPPLHVSICACLQLLL